MTGQTSAVDATAARMRTIARLQLGTGIGLLIFWALFFTVGLAPKNPPPGYFVFEHSFTVPDIILALGLIGASVLLGRTDHGAARWGHVLSLICAGALIFLGMLDISFNLQNQMYTGWWLDAVLALAINIWCLGFGAFVAYALGSKGAAATGL